MAVALGTKVFSRSDKLEGLLESVQLHPISKVVIADDGRTSEKKDELYSRNWQFDLEVLDLEFDAGLGAGRRAIVNHTNEEYLFIMDTDHKLPPSAMTLLDVLKSDADLGGVAGSIFEPNHRRIYDGCRDFDESEDGKILKFISPDKAVEMRDGWAFIPYDFIPNAAVFRRGALNDYCWDKEYVIGWEHGDFYVGHWKQSNWTFGLCPDVLVRHYPGGDAYYKTNRDSDSKNKDSYEYFLEKWGYDDVQYISTGWTDTHPNISLTSGLRETLNRVGVTGSIKRGLQNLLR